MIIYSFESILLCACVRQTQKPGNSRPESSVDLRGAQLHWANELSSKKNVFKVRNKRNGAKDTQPTHGFKLSHNRASTSLWHIFYEVKCGVSGLKCCGKLIYTEDSQALTSEGSENRTLSFLSSDTVGKRKQKKKKIVFWKCGKIKCRCESYSIFKFKLFSVWVSERCSKWVDDGGAKHSCGQRVMCVF